MSCGKAGVILIQKRTSVNRYLEEFICSATYSSFSSWKNPTGPEDVVPAASNVLDKRTHKNKLVINQQFPAPVVMVLNENNKKTQKNTNINSNNTSTHMRFHIKCHLCTRSSSRSGSQYGSMSHNHCW